jgi:hypothetical protein
MPDNNGLWLDGDKATPSPMIGSAPVTAVKLRRLSLEKTVGPIHESTILRRSSASTTRTDSSRNVAVGTVKKSVETRSLIWLSRNALQVLEGGDSQCCGAGTSHFAKEGYNGGRVGSDFPALGCGREWQGQKGLRLLYGRSFCILRLGGVDWVTGSFCLRPVTEPAKIA